MRSRIEAGAGMTPLATAGFWSVPLFSRTSVARMRTHVTRYRAIWSLYSPLGRRYHLSTGAAVVQANLG